MKCPICRKQIVVGDPDFPFCSERCRLLDLGNWASEKYVIHAPLKPEQAQANSDPEAGLDEDER